MGKIIVFLLCISASCMAPKYESDTRQEQTETLIQNLQQNLSNIDAFIRPTQLIFTKNTAGYLPNIANILKIEPLLSAAYSNAEEIKKFGCKLQDALGEKYLETLRNMKASFQTLKETKRISHPGLWIQPFVQSVDYLSSNIK